MHIISEISIHVLVRGDGLVFVPFVAWTLDGRIRVRVRIRMVGERALGLHSTPNTIPPIGVKTLI